ncbi:translesion DNA synthesis-associated protein ImuA [Vibrio hannami]|uniref:translesion DNA synthesis-associated protein ImuA n=1 Tax=Vibrio hannami TaxID=2717094 RepID=UPI002410221F|nr:translesion DNA synthesis-associated protein ImuA [Vibrio hannami]MDG3087643.1 translesion DNA synthesis-associated protein ImuA [Vibrio hannami]
MNVLTDLINNRKLLWKGSEQKPMTEVTSSGYKEMDRQLQGGFPKHGVVEILSDTGIGELRLLTPYIRENSQKRLSVFINPPAYLCAEFLEQQNIDLSRVIMIHPKNDKDALWAAEQSLKSGACGSVCLWHSSLEVHQARRLQVASETGGCLHFFFRTEQKFQVTLPISLSLTLKATDLGLEVSVSKRKGGWLNSTFQIDMSRLWPSLTRPATNEPVLAFPTLKRGHA